MNETNPLDLMNELVEETVDAIKELMDEEVKPLIKYRSELEKKIGKKAIDEMYKMEEDLTKSP